MWADARKHWSSAEWGYTPFKGYPSFWCLPAVWTATTGDGLWSRGRCWGLGLHQPYTLGQKAYGTALWKSGNSPFFPAFRVHFPNIDIVTLFLCTLLYISDGGNSEPFKTIFAFKDTVGKFSWLYHSRYMRQIVLNPSFWGSKHSSSCYYAQELKETLLKIRQVPKLGGTYWQLIETIWSINLCGMTSVQNIW